MMNAQENPSHLKVVAPSKSPKSFVYAKAEAPGEIKGFQKQSANRHFGVHGYFTKQVWAVVQAYINSFSQPGDLVLDPYGGTGVTAIEALMTGRRSIHVDINPLSVFIVSTLACPVDLRDLEYRANHLIERFETFRPKTSRDIRKVLATYPYPRGIQLPRGADVETVEELFSERQLAELSLFKALINDVRNRGVRDHLLLMFSGLLNKLNRTYHASAGRSEGRGDSGVFRYYRYRISHDSPELNLTDVFRLRLKRILAAKRELSAAQFENCIVRHGSATNLHWIKDSTVDYIYTDPPYGSKIAYLDLSTMWLAWLDLPVTSRDRELEAIEGGQARKSREEYEAIITQSLHEMRRVLKPGRWLTLAFSHQDPQYWDIIMRAASEARLDYVNVTRQGNGQSSFKKRQNPFSVISGQLILNFRRSSCVGRRRCAMPKTLHDIKAFAIQTIKETLDRKGAASIEEINDALVIRALESGLLGALSQGYSDLFILLSKHFSMDAKGKWCNRVHSKSA